jgi:hypothetical protein
MNIVEWLAKETDEPFFTPGCLGEVQLVKNGEFLFCVEDGEVVKTGIVYFHALVPE